MADTEGMNVGYRSNLHSRRQLLPMKHANMVTNNCIIAGKAYFNEFVHYICLCKDMLLPIKKHDIYQTSGNILILKVHF